jgi:hypothetical protein
MRVASAMSEDTDLRYVTVLLRLLVTGSGQLIQGEVVSLDQRSLGHFRRWQEAVRVIRSWLTHPEAGS